MLTKFEVSYLALEPFFLSLYRLVRREIRSRIGSAAHPPELLDVGGRKSHYTIGIPANVTITDLPRESEVQKRLNLGIDDGIMRQTRSRRSNVRSVLLDDMTQTALPSQSFDFVVAVEVLEHVEEDESFVRNVARVLRPGGVFLMTTPNGDFVRNTNPDHKRHYSKARLQGLLSSHLVDVEVWYAIKDSVFRNRGIKSWSRRHPVATLMSMAGNLVNDLESRSPRLAAQPIGTRNLIAVGRAPRASGPSA